MTANQDQIQRLLIEVQAVLVQSAPRLPWGSGAQNARQRRVLEQIEAFLKESLFQLNHQAVSSGETEAQKFMQSVIEEMNGLRSTLLHPLHAEVATLMQQRNALVREIRQLEAHRQMLVQPAPGEAALQPQQSQIQADHALTTLDSSLQVVFESLQKDVQAYQESLSQGIDKLHRLGQQSEALFSGIVERLTTQIRQETSASLQPSSASPSLPAQAALTMPYAGTELASPRMEAARSPAFDTITVLTQLIDRLEVEIDELPTVSPAAPPRNGNSGREVPTELKQLFQEGLPDDQPTIEALTYSELDRETTLEQLNVSPVPLPETTLSERKSVIFTLEGIEDLFVDDTKSQPTDQANC